MNELNILEEPIENLQLADNSYFTLVAIYKCDDNKCHVIIKDIAGYHTILNVTKDGVSFSKGFSIVRKNPVVADWLVFFYDANYPEESNAANHGTLWKRLNKRTADEINIYTNSFKIPGTEREI
jgi:hypothetical protein